MQHGITSPMLDMIDRIHDIGEPYHGCVGVDRVGRTSILRALLKRELIARGKWGRWHITERGRRVMCRRVKV